MALIACRNTDYLKYLCPDPMNENRILTLTNHAGDIEDFHMLLKCKFTRGIVVEIEDTCKTHFTLFPNSNAKCTTRQNT